MTETGPVQPSNFVLPETLDAVNQPHPDYGGWYNFIRDHTELRDQHDGVLYFGVVNCNYIVFPSGFFVQNYGYHGKALMNDIRERGANVVEPELRAQRLANQNTVRDLWRDEIAQANNLCDWLKSCPYQSTQLRLEGRPYIESAVPVRVQLSRVGNRRQPFWFGALYCEKHELVAKERVVEEGPMRAGEITRSYRLYLLGRRYDHPKRGDRWVATYDLPDERRQPLERCYSPTNEWYTAFYWQDESTTTPQQRIYSPFGRMFCLILHQSMNFGYYKDWKIDTGEPKPYERLPMHVEYL